MIAGRSCSILKAQTAANSSHFRLHITYKRNKMEHKIEYTYYKIDSKRKWIDMQYFVPKTQPINNCIVTVKNTALLCKMPY